LVELRDLHWDARHRLAFFQTHALAIGRFQISFFAKASIDARQNANWSRSWIAASWSAGSAACATFGVLAASGARWSSWYSNSKADGANCEQQHGREAKGHR
jgi:hypothetical protein